MDEDWDLHALVRSCTTSPTTTTISTAAAAAESDNSETREDPFGSLAILINHEEDNNNNPFHFPNLLSDPKTKYNPFEELQQLYKPFFPTTTAAITALLMKPPPPRLPLPPPPSPFVSELTNNGGILDRNPRAGPSSSSSSSSLSFGPRSRRRKNQQKKVVKQVTAESLSSDMWAWRKYGQKPIKGSPYPRNYYRCSSSKGCPARKQVERSNSDPNMFNITYTGEHTHPRPTHRNSLAGSTRNKHPAAAADDDNNKNNHPENPSRFASSSLSPTTPLLIPPLMDFEVGIETNNDNDDEDDADVYGGDGEDEEMNGADQTVDDDDDADEEEGNILIPNLAMNEDIFMGLQELTDHGLKAGIKSQPSKFTHRLSAVVDAGAGKTNTTSAAGSGGC